jgi:thiopeptide-type bacteriocin biosynthesis protein
MKTQRNSPFSIHDHLLARVAAIPYETYKHRNTQDWLNDPFFLNALQLASENLFNEIRRASFRADQLSPAINRAIRKYANRMASRPVPFGAFSGFLTANFSNERIVMEDNNRLFLQPDLSDLLKSYDQQPPDDDNDTYQTNRTLYHLPAATRYVATVIDPAGNTSFTLRTLPKDRLLSRLTEYCREKQSTESILQFLFQAGLDDQDAKSFLRDLVAENILQPISFPRITGEIMSGPILTYQDIRSTIWTDTDLSGWSPRQWYANLRLQGSGGLSRDVMSDLQDALFALRKLSPAGSVPDLEEFKVAFILRFGNRSVPLMEALDPETGVSYAGLSKNPTGMDLLEGMDSRQIPASTTQIAWGPCQQLLISRWPQQPGGNIALENEDISQLTDNKELLPPGLSILFRYQEKTVWLESCGGCSALQLAGRFSPFDNDLRAALVSIAMEEQKNRPDVVFAEIAAFSEGRTDNISRRAILRDYEIPLTAASSLSDDKQLPPSSLTVAVVNNEIVLWSPRLNRRIIPRLSSAYNYRRSTLPLLRFLCDLQYQGVQHQWTADPAILFPGLDHYPRISYRNVVLTPATWKIESEAIKKAAAGIPDQFRKFAEQLNLPQYVAAGDGDRFLSLNLQLPEDIAILAAEAPTGGYIALREIPAPDLQNGPVINTRGQNHIAQFNAFVTSAHSDSLYCQKIPNNHDHEPILPGMSWFYYKLYLPPANSDHLLAKLAARIRDLRKNGKIRKWFFVRYLDPKPHLRLRLELSETGMPDTIAALSVLFEKEIREGRLHNLVLEPYDPEVDRYHSIGISRAELLFAGSSDLFLAAISKPGFQHHTFALRTTYDSLMILLSASSERLTLMANIRDQLLREEPDEKNIKKILEKKKREMRTITETVIRDRQFHQKLKCKKAADSYLRSLSQIRSSGADRLKLSADLCHMHINRCFPAEMRRQELVLYTLLHQYELTMQKKTAISSASGD